MAIYHFSAKIIGRAAGRSAVAAAAYRCGGALYDERLGRTHNFSDKAGVVHSEVMLPEGAPEALRDRAALWNAVEAGEARKDAQLSREIELAIPREMSKPEGVALVRDFVSQEFVARGMVADLNVHWDLAKDGEPQPHAHVMLTMRPVREDAADSQLGNASPFGAKAREWNTTAMLEHWREAWATHANERLAALGIEARIDHRSYADQGIVLEPQDKIGAAAARQLERGLPSDRAETHIAIARANGEAIVADPAVAFDTITHGQATFTLRDMAKLAHRHSADPVQYDAVLGAMRGSEELVALGRDGRGEERFTSRAMLDTEQRLVQTAERLDARGHKVAGVHVDYALARSHARGVPLSGEQRDALRHVLQDRDLSLVVGYAGSGKSAMLGAAREAWEAQGYQVRGAALSGIAAQNLSEGSGIEARTIASFEHGWAQDRDRLSSKDIFVVDEAGMIGTRQLERIAQEVERAGAKLVLVGDAQQLQAIEAGAAFRKLAERHGAIEISEIRRQQEAWQRQATRALATRHIGEALAAYRTRGMVRDADTRGEARAELIAAWRHAASAAPGESRIILTHTREEVTMLNDKARQRLQREGRLGEDIRVETHNGPRPIAEGERILFLRNERSLGVKNGTLATVERVSSTEIEAKLDSGDRIAFDLKSYADIDHGYATTIHKAQGITVDRTFLLATPGLDAHATYVALSRHRQGVSLHYGRDDFESEAKLARTLGRERAKDMAIDYPAERSVEAGAGKGGQTERVSASASPTQDPQAPPQTRAEKLRAMVTARVNAPKPTAESMREAIAKAAEAAPERGLGKGRDYGAER